MVKKGVSIGANATIVCGHTIGCYAFVGASAVVTKDVPDYALVMGNPAKIAGWVCECGVRLPFFDKFATCSSCGKEYIKMDEGIVRRNEENMARIDDISSHQVVIAS